MRPQLFATKVLALTRLNFRLTIRDPLVPVILLLSPHLMIAAAGATVGEHARLGGSAYNYAVPAASMFFLFFLTTATIHMVHRDIYWGTWSRVVSEDSTQAVILAKFLAAMLVGVTQIASVWLVSYLFYGYSGFLYPGAVLATGLFCAVTAAAGLFFATIGYSLESSASLSNLSVLLFGVAGGAFIPSSRLPAPVQYIGLISPHHWAMSAIETSYRGAGVAWGSIGILLAMAIGLYGIAASRLSFHKLARKS